MAKRFPIGAVRSAFIALALVFTAHAAAGQPVPMLADGHPVNWFFVYKFNSASFPGCANGTAISCPFGGTAQTGKQVGQKYVFASNENGHLQEGGGCLGDSPSDPVGATFNQIYNGSYHYVVWNDQFYDDPPVNGTNTWGHSKGILAWDDDGNGLVMQVSTPSWPGAARAANPRKSSGNTLGCIATPNNVLFAQHFFALKLSRKDVLAVATGLANSSVITESSESQIFSNGGPQEITSAVAKLGRKSKADGVIRVPLSSGVIMISKPSKLPVPPWHLVSAQLGGVPLLTATWWSAENIPDTTGAENIACWATGLGKPGAVTKTTDGHWKGTQFSMKGRAVGRESGDANHAKVGVSLAPEHPYAIFGDMNQDGALSGKCTASQNQRGGLFFVVENADLRESIHGLLSPLMSSANN